MEIYIKKEQTFVCLKRIDKEKSLLMEVIGDHVQIDYDFSGIAALLYFYWLRDFKPSSKQEFMVAYKEAMNSFHNFIQPI